MQRQWAYVRFQPKVQGLNPIYDYAETMSETCIGTFRHNMNEMTKEKMVSK